jgi:hypothetical protein
MGRGFRRMCEQTGSRLSVLDPRVWLGGREVAILVRRRLSAAAGTWQRNPRYFEGFSCQLSAVAFPADTWQRNPRYFKGFSCHVAGDAPARLTLALPAKTSAGSRSPSSPSSRLSRITCLRRAVNLVVSRARANPGLSGSDAQPRTPTAPGRSGHANGPDRRGRVASCSFRAVSGVLVPRRSETATALAQEARRVASCAPTGVEPDVKLVPAGLIVPPDWTSPPLNAIWWP